jgi:lysine N6-hydroxylase
VLTPGVLVRTAGRVATTKVELHLEHPDQGARSRLTTDFVVLATGYRERPAGRMLAGLEPWLLRDPAGRLRTDDDCRLVLDPSVTGSVYVQNAGAPALGAGEDALGLTAWRAARVLGSLTGTSSRALPARTAFTTFGLEPPAPAEVPGPVRRLIPLAHGG